jgi:hypothetical protein
MENPAMTRMMAALHLAELIRNDGPEAWADAWRRRSDSDDVAVVMSQLISFLMENDAARRGISWDAYVDQFRQEAIRNLDA